MAEKIETINVLRVDGTQAVTTLRELKAEIERDKDALVALGVVEEGDVKKKAQQDQITKKLEQDLKLLNQVMAAGKVTTLESAKATDTKTASYYEMQKALTTLKKEWKNLSAAERQEAEGQEILQKIKQLDAELKTLDADIGQFQRNVGNYGMTFKEALDSAQKAAAPLAAGLGALSSVLLINSTNNEKAQKAMKGLQASALVLSGVKGISGLTESVKKSTSATKAMTAGEEVATAVTKKETTAVTGHTGAMVADTAATEGATVATNKFKTALITTGIGAIIVIIGELVALLMVLADDFDKTGSEAKEACDTMRSELDKVTESLNDQIETLRARGALQEEVMLAEINNLAQLRTAYEDYFDKVYETYGASDRAVEAMGEFKDKSEELKNKLLEAKYALEGFVASAQTKKAQEGMSDTEKAIDNVQRRAVQLREIAGTLYDKGIINAQTMLAYLNQIREAEQIEIEAIQEAERRAAGARWRSAKEAAQRIAENAIDAMRTEEERLQAKYERELAYLKKYHVDTTALTAKYEADLQALRDKQAEAERKAAEEEQKQREKDEAQRLADEKKAHEESVKLAREASKEKISQMDKELAWAKRRNDLVEQSDQERAAAEYELTRAANEAKLEALRQFYDEAMALGDQEGALQYQQQAADLSVEIELQAAEEKKRIYDRDRKNREDAAKQTLSSISTTMGALADIFEANTELDEENARKAKNLRIAAATIDMLQGAVTAYSSAQSLGPPLGPIVGGINAAAVIATGLANIAKIKAQKVDANSATTQTPESPAVVQAPTYTPEVTQVRNLTGSSEEERLNKMASSQKVYILNSDLEAAAGARKVQTQETTF